MEPVFQAIIIVVIAAAAAATVYKTVPGMSLLLSIAAALLALLEIARIATGHGKSDNWVDLAGYAACGGELQSRPAVCGK